MTVTNLELPQESPIFDFSRCSPENPNTLYLNVVGIPPLTNIPSQVRYIYATVMITMRRIKTSGRLIMMDNLVPFKMLFQMRSSLTATETILCAWERRDMLKSKINLGS